MRVAVQIEESGSKVMSTFSSNETGTSMPHLRLLEPFVILGSLFIGVIPAGAIVAAGIGRPRVVRERVLRAVLGFFGGAAATLTAAVTLLPYGAPAPQRYVSLDVWADLSGHFSNFPSQGEITQVAINVLLLMWLAVVVPLLAPQFGIMRTIAACLAVSLLIEGLQYVLYTGRVASLSDLLLNTLGATAAAMFAVWYLRPRIERWARSEPQDSRFHQ